MNHLRVTIFLIATLFTSSKIFSCIPYNPHDHPYMAEEEKKPMQPYNHSQYWIQCQETNEEEVKLPVILSANNLLIRKCTAPDSVQQ